MIMISVFTEIMTLIELNRLQSLSINTYHTSNHDHFRTNTRMKVVQLKNSQVEHDEVDSVDVSCIHEVLVGQREPEYDGD